MDPAAVTGASAGRLRVGIVGAGDVAQIVHLPTLLLMSHLYSVEIVCDISRKTAEHCARKFHVPAWTADPEDVFNHKDVDVVFVLTSDDFHEPYTVAALRAGKHVLLEKPVTLSLQSARRILAAESDSDSKARVFVGYMRRYAPSFVAAFKREVAAIPKVLYARVRDFPGPNPHFTSQSGAFQVRNDDLPQGAGADRERRFGALFDEALGQGKATQEKRTMCHFLGFLGSHDISLMRETLGMPERVSGVSAHSPFYTATFAMRCPRTGEPYAAVYESGIDGVPVFDAHLAVYGERKRVRIEYDSPFVKGLPVRVVVEEVNEHGEIQTREILSSYEDAYTAELAEMHACLTQGRQIKTSVEDAIQDLTIYDMMYAEYDRQRQ